MNRFRNLLTLVLCGALGACSGSATDAPDGVFDDIGFALDAPGADTDLAAADATHGDDARGEPDTSGELPGDAKQLDLPGDDGDGSAEAAEVDDVGPDAPEVVPACECGDQVCVTPGCGETAFSCPADCCVCGDDACVPEACAETPDTCPTDCALWVCGNGACEPGETLATCAEDCGDGTCGNGACEEGEDATSCATDCALPCPECDDGDPCTLDDCDLVVGACVHAPAPSTGGPDATCDGVDDDCDGAVDEDWQPTATTCGAGPCAATGVLACQAGAPVDTCAPLPAGTEACNGQDDDCDGELDEACPCPVRVYEGRPYQFCTDTDRWTDARATCADHPGYHLVLLGGEAENAWVAATAATFSADGWWTGLNDREHEGTFSWADGSAPTYTAWADGEPNNAWGNEDCVLLVPGDATWNDDGCSTSLRFVCEYE